jgi:zinc protease
MTPASGLVPIRHVLSNGLTLITADTNTTPAVTVLVAVDAGAAADPPLHTGLSYFLSRTIDRGTAARSADMIADALDGVGASLTVSTSVHTLTLACTCLSDDLDGVLPVLADVVRRPSFPENEVGTRRGEIVTTIRQDADNPAVVANAQVLAMLYGGAHPYGRPIRGSVASVTRIEAGDLRAFHRSLVAPAATTVVLVGDVEAGRALDAVGAVLGDWIGDASMAPRVEPVAPPSARRVSVLPMMSKAQTELAYAVMGVSRRDPSYEAVWLMNNVLGQYALGGRLGESIRERQGMAYHVSSSLESGVIAGPLVVRAGISAENVVRTVASIDAELSTLASDGPTVQEVRESTQYLVGSIPRWLETNGAIAGFLQMAEFHGLGLDYHLRVGDRLRSVTHEEVRAAARALLRPEEATVAVAGPFGGQLA